MKPSPLRMTDIGRRPCSPVFKERNEPGKLAHRLKAAWLAWKASAQCPAGEASWDSREFLASIRPDGTLELVEKTGMERETFLHPAGKTLMFADDMRRQRPPPSGFRCRKSR